MLKHQTYVSFKFKYDENQLKRSKGAAHIFQQFVNSYYFMVINLGNSTEPEIKFDLFCIQPIVSAHHNLLACLPQNCKNICVLWPTWGTSPVMCDSDKPPAASRKWNLEAEAVKYFSSKSKMIYVRQVMNWSPNSLYLQTVWATIFSCFLNFIFNPFSN